MPPLEASGENVIIWQHSLLPWLSSRPTVALCPRTIRKAPLGNIEDKNNAEGQGPTIQNKGLSQLPPEAIKRIVAA